MSVDVRKAPDPAARHVGIAAMLGRVLSIGGALLALGAIALAAVRLQGYNQQIAQKQSELTHFQQQVSAKQQELSSAQSKLDQLNAELAFAQSAYQKIADTLPNGEAQKAIQETITADQQAASLPPVLYIHISREDQRAKAEEVQNTLRARGYTVPGIEYVGKKSPDESQLRYFIRTDQGPALNRTLELLHSMGIDANSQYIAKLAPRALRPHQFELWFGQNYQPPQPLALRR